MASLGSVLGAVVAELARARVVADRMTRDLVEEYESDSVLSTLSVPRVVMRDAEVVLRFSVRGVEAVEVSAPDPGELRDAWYDLAAARMFSSLLERQKLSEAERAKVLSVVREAQGSVVGRPTLDDTRRALAGDSEPIAAKTVAPVVDSFTKLPRSIRAKLGSKAKFRDLAVRSTVREVDAFLGRVSETAKITAALASKLDIEIVQDELPQDPAQTQEVRFTLRGEDLDVIVGESDISGGP